MRVKEVVGSKRGLSQFLPLSRFAMGCAQIIHQQPLTNLEQQDTPLDTSNVGTAYSISAVGWSGHLRHVNFMHFKRERLEEVITIDKMLYSLAIADFLMWRGIFQRSMSSEQTQS